MEEIEIKVTFLCHVPLHQSMKFVSAFKSLFAGIQQTYTLRLSKLSLFL